MSFQAPPPPGPCAANASFAAHPGFIGDQRAFLNGDFKCSSAAACPAEAERECDSLSDCRSYAIDPAWGEGAAAQLYSTGLAAAGRNAAWTLWIRQCNSTPAPPPSPVGPAGFRQELDLATGSVNITASARGASVLIRVWSDAGSLGTADSIHVDVTSSVATTASVSLDLWRTAPFQQPTHSTARGPCAPSVLVEPDTVASPPAGAPGSRLVWYRLNNNASFKQTMADQMLGRLASAMPDPLLGRASGGLVTGSTDGVGLANTNGTQLRSGTPGVHHAVSIFTHTAVGCGSGAAFVQQVADRAAASPSPGSAWPNHTAWWGSFWERGWIVLNAAQNQTLAAGANATSEAYQLNRYLVAIQSRGALAMHHNGGTVTWGWDGHTHGDPDARPWGGGYWFQNVRHSYWYALAAGDFDLLEPLFAMYLEQLPVLEERSRRWWGYGNFDISFFFFLFWDHLSHFSRMPQLNPTPRVQRYWSGDFSY